MNKLLGAVPEVTFAIIMSTEGLLVESTLPQSVTETRIAVMTAALLSLSERAITEIEKGDFDYLYIKTSEGYLLVMQTSLELVLAAFTAHCDISLTKRIKTQIESMDYNFLKKLLEAIPEVKSDVIKFAEILSVASTLPQAVKETRIEALTTALLSLSERVIVEMKKGEFEELHVKGSDGSLSISDRLGSIKLKIQ